jgi:hypothetical protein
MGDLSIILPRLGQRIPGACLHGQKTSKPEKPNDIKSLIDLNISKVV